MSFKAIRFFLFALLIETASQAVLAQNTDVRYVDLGLSVLWGDCNLGAESPTDYGCYYAWGETEPKDCFSWDNYHKYEPPREETDIDDEDLLHPIGLIGSLSRRNRNNEPLRLISANDAATVRLGAEWRMPTIQEYNELYANCDYDTVTVNGVLGLRYTSRIVGYEDKSIFIPYGGYIEGGDIIGVDLGFWVWTSESDTYSWDGDSSATYVSTSNTVNPSFFYLDEELRVGIGTKPSLAGNHRYIGLNIRPVRRYDSDTLTSFELSTANLGLDYGEIRRVNAVIGPSGRQAENGEVRWSTSSDSVAVCQDGTVTAIGVGTCVITAEYKGHKAQMTVNVTMPELIPVDLGLSVKWASANMGASSPRKAGAYIAWGETSPKAGLYPRDNYKTVWTEKLEPEKDAVMVRIGGGWRMPDADDLWELKNKCSWQTIDTKDSCGYIITSNVPGYEGRSIFLPAVGYKTAYEGKVSMNQARYGTYKTLAYNTSVADVGLGSPFKWEGCPIRPVLETAGTKKAGPDPVKPLNHDAMVDLGLSVLWADCNVGANSPEELGARFAWGETAQKTYYTKDNYQLNGKYNSWGARKKLDAADDAAHVNWGGDWRMPTKEEYAELFKNCEWADTTINGVEGFLFTSKVPGYTSNSVFLPFTNGGIYTADGGLYLTSDAAFRYENSCAVFTISKFKSGTNDEIDLGLENYEDWGCPNSEIHIPSRNRYEGGWVRAVCPK
jgi:hypothetical protein